MTTIKAAAMLGVTTLLCLAGANAALAGSKSLTLDRLTLSNSKDADGGGLWQYEGGNLLAANGTSAGTYIISRRVTTSGTSLFNTAAETITLFFTPKVTGDVPEVITLEGAHSFNTGNFVGSVSAASSHYSWIIGADASAAIPSTGVTVLSLAWNGSKGLSVP